MAALLDIDSLCVGYGRKGLALSDVALSVSRERSSLCWAPTGLGRAPSSDQLPGRSRFMGDPSSGATSASTDGRPPGCRRIRSYAQG
jgi:hypothetical protein